MSLLEDLKRRRVIRISAAYIVVSWLILQVADITFPIIPIPDWGMRALLIVLVLAFPIVVLVAWLFQVQPSGDVKREKTRASHGRLAILGLVALLIGGGLGWLWSSLNSPSESGEASLRPRIAVLPLEDMSPGGDKAYFSDGIHEELISRLSEIRDLAVTSRTSVSRYRESTLLTREIAEELDVDLILEGSVRHSGQRVRITLQLIDAKRDEHVWVRDFDKELSMDALFDIQRDVSSQIANLLHSQVSPDELQSLAHLPTENLEAYEAYLKGSYHYRRYSTEDLRTALEYWHRATELDPGFFDAWAGLANGYMLASTTYGWMEPAEAIPEARKYGAIAVKLNPYDGAIISLIGDIAYWYDWDAVTGEAKYVEGIAVDPNHLGNRQSYAYLLSTQGRHEEALAQINFCLEREPRATYVHQNAAWRNFDARRYQDAIKHADIALSIDPGLVDAIGVKAYSLILLDRLEEAEPLIDGNWLATVAWLMRSGREEEARAYLDNIDKGNAPIGDLITPYAVAGEFDQAFEYLDASIQARYRGVLTLNIWEFYDSMRSDPRFNDALRRIGFDEIEVPPGE